MSLQQILFIIIFLGANVIFVKNALKIRQNIKLGRPLDRKGQRGIRLKNMMLLAFGQKKMFKRPLVALLHLVVYVSFFIVNIELIEIVLDGILGKHRIFQEALGGFYNVVMFVFELLAVGVIISCGIFLIRRNVLKISRFHKAEMTSWPKLDANLILLFEIILMFAFINMNATDAVMHGKEAFAFSQYFTGLYTGMEADSVHFLERTYWWVHIVLILFFANYVLFSKHLHIFLAFPNTYFANLFPKGKMENMETVTNEVKIMLGITQAQPAEAGAEIPSFGAKDVTDLTWKNLLDAFTCTECGRCTDNCPANMTGKKLSPRKIMMDTRDRAEELGDFKRKNGKDKHDGKSLSSDDYITDEELFACTTCNACVEACPISIDPLNIILEMRRYKVMEQSQGPSEWNMMYQNMETSFSPWKFPPTDRFNWASDLNKDK